MMKRHESMAGVSGRTVNLYNIMRVGSGGGAVTDLTADVADQAKGPKWR